jgi:hypothetical protein
MIEFFQAGGVAMWFVLLFGVASLVAAGAFAVSPDPRKVEAVRALTGAAVFSIAAGIVADLAKVGSTVASHPEWSVSPKIHLIVMQGFAESMTPGVLGFSLLALTWMVMAVGHRRLARELPAGV